MLKISVLTPDKEILSNEVEEITIQSADGEIGILEGHAELFASVISGILRLKNKGKTDFFAVHHGFIRVNNDEISILVKFCENPQIIDKTRLEAAENKAIENLQQTGDAKWQNKLLRSATRRELIKAL
jgi:F-type H+-transporting ATPase subunit epsilon